MSGLLIVGSGHAGLTLAREWRKRDPDTALTIITADDGAAYYKPNLSKSLAGGKSADDLVTASAEDLAATHQATLRARTRVVALHPQHKQVELEDGERLDYRDLVLAHGARCRELPLAGDAAGDVLHVNDRLDYARFRDALPAGGHVLLIGAGLIGSEYANDLLASGHRVTLVDPLAWPLGTLLPQALGEDLKAALAEAGAGFHLGRSVRAVHREGAGLAAELDDGTRIAADVVLSAVGLQPNVDLARAAGLDCGRGIRTDAQLQTSAAHIYALGDVAEVCGHVLPYILPITGSARALAATLAGEPTPVNWPAMPVIVKTPLLPTIVCPPPAGAAGAWQVEGDAPGRIARFVGEDGSQLGFALTGSAVRERGRLAGETQAPKLG